MISSVSLGEFAWLPSAATGAVAGLVQHLLGLRSFGTPMRSALRDDRPGMATEDGRAVGMTRDGRLTARDGQHGKR